MFLLEEVSSIVTKNWQAIPSRLLTTKNNEESEIMRNRETSTYSPLIANSFSRGAREHKITIENKVSPMQKPKR